MRRRGIQLIYKHINCCQEKNSYTNKESTSIKRRKITWKKTTSWKFPTTELHLVKSETINLNRINHEFQHYQPRFLSVQLYVGLNI